MLDGPTQYSFGNRKGKFLFGAIFFSIAGVAAAVIVVLQFMIVLGGLSMPSMGKVDPLMAFAEIPMGFVFLYIGVRSILCLYKRLPVLEIKADGVRYMHLSGTYWAHWSSLLPFRILMVHANRGGNYPVILAQIVGPEISPNLAKERDLTLNNEYDRPLAHIMELANKVQTEYYAKNPSKQPNMKVSII